MAEEMSNMVTTIEPARGSSRSDFQVRSLITRRRGACDGNSWCGQCKRLGFDCVYSTLMQKKRASTRGNSTTPAPASIQQVEGIVEKDTVLQSTEEHNLGLSETDLFQGVFISRLPPCQLQESMISTAADYSMNFLAQTSENSGSFPTHFDVLPDLNWDMCSPVLEQFSLERSASISSKPADPPAHSARANNFIATGRMQQNDLIKGAILQEIQKHCDQRHYPQSNDLCHVFRGLISGKIVIHPSEKSSGDIGTDHVLRVHREHAFKCVAGKFSQNKVNKKSEALIDNQACFKDPQGISTFLDEASLEFIMRETLDRTTSCPSKRALAHITLALGTHIIRSDGIQDLLKESGYQPLTQFKAALELKVQIQREKHFSVLNFQFLMTLAYFAATIDLSESSELIFTCVHYAQVMRLGSRNAADRLCMTMGERQQIRKGLWFLYSFEKISCMREETFPALDEDFVDYDPPMIQSALAEHDWLVSRYQFGSLCASILKQVYGQRSLQYPDLDAPSDLEKQLDLWTSSLPPGFHPGQLQVDDFSNASSQDRTTKLHVMFQYHEVVLAINARWLSQEQQPLLPEIDQRYLERHQKLSSSARTILLLSCHLTESDVRLNPALCRLVCIATCTIATGAICHPADRGDLPYLATAAGFFGRMALGSLDVPIEDIMEVIRVAQESIKGKMRRGSSYEFLQDNDLLVI
ncbi:hypothetical protein BKA64DRAFT_706378 [Cadophora sp. MPI-SDFR-AT-0126]|nr:hypothetical protein BKA64DRAFT_706378 [Leotiomycetes sp. MPI-SDFR-AT-0126]